MLVYERIVHEVTRSVATRDLMRIHIGFRITDSVDPLFTNLDAIITEQGFFYQIGTIPPFIHAYSNFPRIQDTQ